MRDLLVNLIAAGIIAMTTWGWRKLTHKNIRFGRLVAIFLIVFVVLVGSNLTPIKLGETLQVAIFGPPTLNERWATEAWDAYNGGAYDSAIEKAARVVEKYGASARREQSAMKRRKSAEPPTGTSWNPFAASQTLSRGPLNDVSASFYIIARSNEERNECDAAKAAYQELAQFDYARAWDSQWWPIRGWSPFGWFWSPAQTAKDRLATFDPNNKGCQIRQPYLESGG